MSQRIDPFDYANHIAHALRLGILLNTNGDKFNSMVIGWGHMGVIWNKNTFVVYVRESRYTHAQLDKTGLFTISSPWAERGEARLTPEIMRAFGSESGRDIDKADYVTLVKGQTIDVPAIAEYPLTLECRVLYRQDQDPAQIPPQIRNHHYAGGDYHTAYIGEIVDAYIL